MAAGLREPDAPPLAADPAPPQWCQGDALLDLRGEVCPFTFVRAKVLLEELLPGACLRLLVDHLPAVSNLPRSLRDWGQRVLQVALAAEPQTWHIDVQKLVD